MSEKKQNLPPQGERLVYQTDDGQVTLDDFLGIEARLKQMESKNSPEKR